MLPETLKSQEYSKFDKCLMLFSSFAILLPEYILPIIAVVFFAVLYHTYSSVTKKMLFGRSGKVFFSYTIYMLVSIVWSTTRIHTLATAIIWMIMFSVFLCVSNTCDSKKKVENTLMCLSISGAFASVIAILQSVFAYLNLGKFFPNPLYRPLDNLFYSYLPSFGTQLKTDVDGASGTFESPLMLASFLVLVMPVSVFLAFYAGTKKRRKYCIAISVIIFVGLLLTYARGAAAALVISLIILAFNSKKSAAILLPSSMASGLIMSFVIFEREKEGLFSNLTDWFKISEWKTCIESIITHPIFGLGSGTKGVTDILNQSGSGQFHSYNLFIQLTTEGGFFGLIFFAAIIITVLTDIYKISRCAGWWKHLATALLSSMVGFLIMSMFEFTLRTPKEILYFAFLLGISEAAKRVSQKHKELYDAEAIEEHNRLLREQSL